MEREEKSEGENRKTTTKGARESEEEKKEKNERERKKRERHHKQHKHTRKGIRMRKGTALLGNSSSGRSGGGGKTAKHKTQGKKQTGLGIWNNNNKQDSP